jgi:hypothetical protein
MTSHADAARIYLQTQRPQERFERTIAYGADLVGTYSFHAYAYGKFVDIAVEMEQFAGPHTIDLPPEGPGIVHPATFPCYARPWWL